MRQPVPSQSRAKAFGSGLESLVLIDRQVDLSVWEALLGRRAKRLLIGDSLGRGRVLCLLGYYDARPPPPRLAAILLLIRTQWAALGAGPSGRCGAAAAGLSNLRCLPGAGRNLEAQGAQLPWGAVGARCPGRAGE